MARAPVRLIQDASPWGPELSDLMETFRKYLYLNSETAHIEIGLATVLANRGKGDPVWVLIVGPAGSGKTEPLNAVSTLSDVRSVSTLTPAALLSGTSKAERSKEATGGLLHEIGSRGTIVIKDFGSIIAMQRDIRAQTMAALREIYDGAWTRHLGTDGGKVLEWRGHCGLLGAVTSQIDSTHGVSSALGERYALCRIGDENDLKSKGRRAALGVGEESSFRPDLGAAVAKFLDAIEPVSAPLSDDELDRLIALASLTTRGRSPVERESTSGREIVNRLDTEHPTRFVKMLVQLTWALLAMGVKRQRTFHLIEKIALDSMPPIRSDIMRAFGSCADGWREKELAVAVKYASTTTRRALEEMEVHGIVQHTDENGHKGIWVPSSWFVETWREARIGE